MPTLSVIVPATNRPPTLERCRAAILASAPPPDELIVVEEPANAGPAAARNAGVARATGDVVVFVDADVEVHPDAFTRVRNAFSADPELTALFGSYDDAPAAPGAVSGFRNLLHHHVHTSSPGDATTFWAGLGAVRRDRFTNAGGFDEHAFRVPSVEDIELGMRLTAGGARIRLDPAIRGKHLKDWSFVDMVRTDLLRRGVPWVGLLLSGGSSSALNLGWRHRASAVSSVVLVGAAVLRRPLVAASAAGTLVTVNRGFYGLLLRRLGPARAGLGVGLHVVHHLTGVAAVPLGILAHLADRRR